MNKFKLLSILVLIALMSGACGGGTATPAKDATPEDAATEASAAVAAYTVAAGDTLPDLADKNFGNKDYSWAIYGLTNLKHNSDPSFTQITNADVIEPGSKIYIPTQDEVDAFMADFDVTNPDFAKLRPVPDSGQLLVGNFWTSGGEYAGISGVYDLYRTQYPGVDLVHAGTAGGAGVNFNALALTKLQGGDPFDVMQMHVAKEVLLFDPETYLTPLEDLVEETQGAFLPETLKSALTVNGHTTLCLSISTAATCCG